MAKTRVGQISPLYYKKVAGHLPLIQDASQRVGNVFYVDSGDGTDSTGYGTHPDTPFATLDYAVGQCTANQGDVIFVLPGHAETIAAAAGIDADIAGISIIGLGDGADRPTITFATSTAADMDIDAASITVRNLIFVCGIDEQVLMIDVNAANFTIEDCEFRGTAAAQFLTAIDVNGGAANACDRATIRRCKFVSYTAAATANDAISLDEVADEVAIEDCVIDGDWGNAGIHNPTGKVLTNLRILRNVIRNRQTGDHAIELVSACTGEAVGNALFGDTAAALFDPGSLFTAGNKFGQAIDQESLDYVPLWPTAAAPANGVSLAAALRDAWDALRNGTGGAEPGTNKSIIDAIGFDGAAVVAASAGMLRTMAGTVFVVKKALTSSAIVQAGVDVTGVSSVGDIFIEDVVITADATGLAGGTNLTLETNNAKGATPFFSNVITALGANGNISLQSAATTRENTVLESGKKIVAKSTVADCTGAGTIDIYLICRRLADNATLAAA